MGSTTTKVSPDSLMNGHARPRRKPHRISTHGGGARKSSGKRNRREAQTKNGDTPQKAKETETERKATETKTGEAYKKKHAKIHSLSNAQSFEIQRRGSGP